MSNKLDASLDEILKSHRQNKNRGRGGRRPDTARPTPAGPVGGVGKNTKQTKQAKAPNTGAAAPENSTKILVSGLPVDVDQAQLQDYFVNAVNTARPKKIIIQYGPTGVSLGSATVIFNRHDQAVKATASLNGVKIDNRPVKVEMLVSASNVAAPAAQPSLADRVTNNKKDKPKPAMAPKAAQNTGIKSKGRGGGRGGRGGRPGRQQAKKKTVEELDAEMADYFPAAEGTNDTTAIATGGAPTAAGDTAMDDEML